MLKPKVIDKLIKLHVDKLKRKVNERIQQEAIVQSLQNAINHLYYDIELEKQLATRNLEVTYSFQSYYKQAKAKMLDLGANLTMAQVRLDDIIDEVKELHVEVNKFEYLSDNLRKATLAALEKEEAKVLDEYNRKLWNSSS